jgi:hypothetical protein
LEFANQKIQYFLNLPTINRIILEIANHFIAFVSLWLSSVAYRMKEKKALLDEYISKA